MDWQSAVSSYVINNEKSEDKYHIIDKLGRGSFGFVLLATEKNPPQDKEETKQACED